MQSKKEEKSAKKIERALLQLPSLKRGAKMKDERENGGTVQKTIRNKNTSYSRLFLTSRFLSHVCKNGIFSDVGLDRTCETRSR